MTISTAEEVKLILKSRVTAAVLGSSAEFEVLFLDEDHEAQAQSAQTRGLSYFGLLGISKDDGELLIEFAPGADVAVMTRAAVAFVQKLTGVGSKGDAVEWCRRLFSLEDPRTHTSLKSCPVRKGRVNRVSYRYYADLSGANSNSEKLP